MYNIDEVNQLMEKIIYAAKRCFENKLQTGNGGNLSARIPNSELMIIKTSSSSFGDMTKDDLVVCTFNGEPVNSDKKPSKECMLHGAIYLNSNNKAIVHCHSPWAVSAASSFTTLPMPTYHSALKLKDEIKIFDTHSYAVPEEYIKKIMEIFYKNKEINAFLLKGHGQVSMGKSIMDALYTAELIEETAQIAILEKILIHK